MYIYIYIYIIKHVVLQDVMEHAVKYTYIYIWFSKLSADNRVAVDVRYDNKYLATVSRLTSVKRL